MRRTKLREKKQQLKINIVSVFGSHTLSRVDRYFGASKNETHDVVGGLFIA
jgi:hypothetical protein